MKATEKEFEVETLINEVLDAHSFVKTLALVKGKSSLGEAAGEGVVSGFGTIDDIKAGVFGTVHEVLLGGLGKKGAKKISQTVDNAVKTGSAVIGFIDSEGARFAEGIKAMEGYAGITNSLAAAHGVVPVILVVTGASYGMLSYLSAFCDLCIAMPSAKIASSSPLLLAAAAGVDQKDVANILVHQRSGLITNAVANSAELKKLIVDALNILTYPVIECKDDANRLCKSLKIGASTTEIIKEVVDNKRFIPVRDGFGGAVITGFARLNGTAVGIIATDYNVSNGRITADGAFKAASFISTCNNFDLPIVAMVDSDGVINNLAEENGSLIRNISDMLYAIHTSVCCKVSLISGHAIGLAYSALCTKHTVDYSIAWDGASIGMLTDTQTATLLYSGLIANAKDKAKATEELASSYGSENSSAAAVAESGYIDNVINPTHTRQYLISAVETFGAKR